MHEETLALFFESKISAKELAADLEGPDERLSAVATVTRIHDMDRDFAVRRDMAIRLCDSVLNRELEAAALGTIGFALMASDRFTWDADDILGDIIAYWSCCPEINYPLTVENVRRFRAWLSGDEQYSLKPKSVASGGGRIKMEPVSAVLVPSVADKLAYRRHHERKCRATPANHQRKSQPN